MNAVLTAQRIAGIVAVEAGDRGSKPGRGSRTCVLYQSGVCGMLKSPLAFAVVVETEFIDGVVADRPGVSNVPLLDSFCQAASKARDIRSQKFEIGERTQSIVII